MNGELKTGFASKKCCQEMICGEQWAENSKWIVHCWIRSSSLSFCMQPYILWCEAITCWCFILLNFFQIYCSVFHCTQLTYALCYNSWDHLSLLITGVQNRHKPKKLRTWILLPYTYLIKFIFRHNRRMLENFFLCKNILWLSND